jgi:mono/diheme cytochrome c family protein
MAKIGFILLSLICFNAAAEPVANPLFAKADVAAGKTLHEKNCISCHASSYGGDGTGIYTRDYAKVKTSKGLVAQVRNCNTMIGLKWFEDEELNVAAYLNQTYYKFSQ